jgi:phosphatidylserine/phosphatidylglycerophosphate/cardiolipin synthase-like enzyme
LGTDTRVRSYPQGRSEIGTAVNRAVFETDKGTVDRSRVFTQGSIEDIWVNDTDAEDEAITQVIAMLKTAQTEISIQTFYFKPKTEAAQRLLAALAEKQVENPDFKVYIAFNRDLLPVGTTLAKALEDAGVEAQVAYYAGPTTRKSNHTKMFVVDGREAIIGGDNIDNPTERDVMVRLRGPVVDAMLSDFDQAWATSKRWLNGTATPPKHRKGPEVPSTQPMVPITMLTKEGIDWRGDYTDNDADQGLIAAMNAAKTSMRVMSPNLNDIRVWDGIEAAAKRGVKVQILLPQNFGAIGPWIDRATNKSVPSFIAQLPEGARKNVELRWFAEDGQTVADSHTKYLSVDGKWAYVGSQNMDNQAWAFSREVGIGVDDASQVKRLDAAVFEADWATSIPVELKPEDLSKALPARNWGERVKRWFTPD